MDNPVLAILPLYNEGLRLYKERKWKEAVTYFEKALEKYPEDGPSLTLLKRCQLLQQDSKMGKDWDGIYSISSK